MAEATDASKRNAMLIEFQQAVIQFNSMLATIQQQNTALSNDKRDLKEKIVQMETWNTEKERYKMAAPFRGATVYALKKSMSDGEPAHYMCTNCFKAGKPSILQLSSDKDGYTAFTCPLCKCAARTGYRGASGPLYVEDIEAKEQPS